MLPNSAVTSFGVRRPCRRSISAGHAGGGVTSMGFAGAAGMAGEHKAAARPPHSERRDRYSSLAWLGVMSLLLSALALAQSPTFHGDYQRTGRSQDAGPVRPRLFWKFDAGASIVASPVIGADGTVYVAGTDGRLVALTPYGTRKWEFQAWEGLFATPSLDASGRLYFGDLDGWFYSLASDGTLRWRCRLEEGSDNRILGSAGVTPEGILFVAAWNNHLYALAPDGSQLWRSPLNGLPTSAPALDSHGNVYVACLDSATASDLAIHKFSSASPTPVWTRREPLGTRANRVISTPAIDIARNRLYIGSCTRTAGLLIAINLTDGGVVFRKAFPKGIISSPAIRDDGVILVGCLDGRLYALDPDAGTERWVFQTDAPYIFGSPTADRSGNVYVGDADGAVYLVSPRGQGLWQLITDSNVESAPVIQDGRLFVTSFDGWLYVVDTYSDRRPRDGRRIR